MKPVLLDLFCCAGGAAKGYREAGFKVLGVDINPQPNYPYAFHRGDALDFLVHYGHLFDVIHASPPCQNYANVTAWRGNQDDHPNMLPMTRELLEWTGKPFVIENVPEAPLRHDLLLCGSHFDIRVRRHRAFESNIPLVKPQRRCAHTNLLPFMHKGERAYADAMGCDWMTAREGRQAIPPAYSRFIGSQLIGSLQ